MITIAIKLNIAIMKSKMIINFLFDFKSCLKYKESFILIKSKELLKLATLSFLGKNKEENLILFLSNCGVLLTISFVFKSLLNCLIKLSFVFSLNAFKGKFCSDLFLFIYPIIKKKDFLVVSSCLLEVAFWLLALLLFSFPLFYLFDYYLKCSIIIFY